MFSKAIPLKLSKFLLINWEKASEVFVFLPSSLAISLKSCLPNISLNALLRALTFFKSDTSLPVKALSAFIEASSASL